MSDLNEIVQKTRLGIAESSRKSKKITSRLLSDSKTLDGRNFQAISSLDLQQLFKAIDAEYFQGLIQNHLDAHKQDLKFRVSKRMTSSGGITTTQFDSRTHAPNHFEIAISSTLLFESFNGDKPIVVTGLLCGDRLQALARIMEHEMIHLLEMLLWHDSSCARSRFQNIAFRFFRHRQSNHQLITPGENAKAKYNIAAGDWVEFVIDDKRLFGYVNRITRRATVLVPHQTGTEYSDGKKYLKYYVPVNRLRRAA